MRVSVALIVKNEERTLGRCLDHLRGAVDEIVVVDTGSDDATLAIARRYTDRVFTFPWRDDFAAARQFAFDQATGDWVCWVDADDVVLGADQIRPMLADADPEVGGFYWPYVLGRNARGVPTFEYWRERCVRNDGSFRWVGRVHEVLVAQRPWQLRQAPEVIVEHHPEPGRAAAVGRNLRILEQEYAAADGVLEPRRLFYLAREYADTGNTERAIAIFQEYLQVGTWADECYLARVQLAELFRQQERYPEALDADLQALKVHPRWPHAYFGLARSYYFLRDWPKVIHWCDLGRQMPAQETLLFVNPAEFRYGWIIYYTNALFQTGQMAAALDWTRRALALGADRRWHLDNLFVFGRLQDQSGPIAIQLSPPDLPTYAVIPVRDGHELTRPLLGQLGLPPERVIVIDNGSSIPARETLAGLARVTDAPRSSLSAVWNLGLDLVAAECCQPHNVAVLNNDLEVSPDFLPGLAAGLRTRPDHVIAYPDVEERLAPGICEPAGRMTGFAFMLRGEAGMRADPQFAWWYGDDDLEWRARQRGKVVRVGGVHVRHLTPNQRTMRSPELQAIAAEDLERFLAKWCADAAVPAADPRGQDV